MGVQGLWELLAPVGRRVSVETLAGKRLAIDASIWMVQFMKAMRDERGEMVRNAHLVGFFRRICKLLFLRTKPVFVFDGGTPALKRRTVAARRRHRDNAQAKIRKTAEKLLLNHLRARKLEELANEMKIRKEKDTLKGKEVLKSHDGSNDNNREGNEKNMKTYNRESLDEMLAASLAAEENLNSTGSASTSTGFNPPEEEEEEDGDENEEMVLPVMHAKVDPTILAALPPSLQLDLLVQMREQQMAENRKKYQKVKKTPTKFSELQIQSYLKTVAFRREIDEVQKSAAGRGVGGMQASRIASEPNREFIFSSSFTGDKRMLSSTGADKNGDSVPQTPGKEPVHSASVGSVSSQVHSVGVTAVDEPSGDETRGFNYDVETYVDERGRVRVSRVRGLGIRMTRDLQRNLDLMKELEMEKRKENVSKYMEAISDGITLGAPKVAQASKQYLESSTGDKASKQVVNLIGMVDGIPTQIGEDLSCDQPAYAGKDSMEISFFEDETKANNTEVDDLFAQLVTGNSNFSTESVPCGKHTSEISDDHSLAEVAPKGSFSRDVEKSQPSLADNSICDEGEVDWEEGTCEVPMDTSHSTCENKRTVSRGHLEEEADIQEAIRRSLEDITKENSILLSSLGEYVEHSGDMRHPPDVLLENNVGQCQVSYGTVEGDDLFERSENGGVNTEAVDSLEKEIIYTRNLDVKTDGKSALMEGDYELNPESNTVVSSHNVCIDRKSELMEGDDERNVESNTIVSSHNVCTDRKVSVGKAPSDASSKESMESSITGLGYLTNNPNEGRISASSDECAVGSSGVISQALNAVGSDSIDVIAKATNQDSSEASHSCHASEKGNKHPDVLVDTFAEKMGTENGREQKSLMGNLGRILTEDGERNRDEANQISKSQPYVSETTLDEEMLLLQQERMDLGDEQRKLERNAESVSSEMFAECQELLQMFGLPYIIAQMEAEAQCAYMELMNLVDGVVTDDSDVFLFGARSVYKNIFDDRKYVETYFMKDIESELGLTREKLIHMALLLGSDYTEGVSGIGIVNAIEVVHAFPEEDGLQKFREWVESPDPAIFGKLDAYMGNSSRKKVSKARTVDADDSAENVNVSVINEDDICDGQQSSDNLSKTRQMFMDKHRNVSKNWHIPSSFPSGLVIHAYTSPQVDKSAEPFSWGKPDQFMLRKLCWERFGWTNQKADELLVPVLKEYNKHETQLRLEAFYTFNERFAKIRSQRIKKAVRGITGNRASELMDGLPKEGASSGKKRRGSPLQTEQGMSSYGMDNAAAKNDNSASGNTVAKKPRKQKTVNPLKHSAAGTLGRKADRGKGKGHVRGGGRTRRKAEAPNFKSTEASSSDRDDNIGKNIHLDATEDSFKLRRSARPRKLVAYAPKDLEIDISESSSPSDTDSLGGKSRDWGPASGKKSLDQETVSNQGTVEDATGNVSSLDDSLIESSRDCIQSGGGFCMDNDGDQTHDESPGLEDPVSENVSREYLFSGGGFCVDDGDDQNEQAIQNSPSSPRAVDELLPGEKVISCEATQCLNAEDFSSFDRLTNKKELSSRNPHEADTDGGVGNSPSQLTQQTDIHTGEPTPEAAFSAMPSLRRKRRKT